MNESIAIDREEDPSGLQVIFGEESKNVYQKT